MDNSPKDSPVVFLLGAGFNCDVAKEAGKADADTLPSSGKPAKYPLVGDLLNQCFDLQTLPADKSVEDLFQESIDSGNQKPRDVLYNWLMELDYYLAPLLMQGGSHENNVYRKFLHEFPQSPLLTFNYDSLPEILLLKERFWCPLDGYGVALQVNTATIRKGLQPIEVSQRSVLHLHGSLCVYAVTYGFEKHPDSKTLWMVDRSPEFLFDPDALGYLFRPFERIAPGMTYSPPRERVIAPIPNKAEKLAGQFINEIYQKADGLVRAASQLVCLGYSFNRHDQQSYEELLRAASGKPALVVAPNAEVLVKRLAVEFPKVEWLAQSMSFASWVSADYPGVQ